MNATAPRPAAQPGPQPGTRQQILDHAEILMRRVGYAAFSYADLAARLGTTKAAIHYHFPSKEILVGMLLMHCMARTRDVMAVLQADAATPNDALRAYARIFADSVAQDLLPICCASAADRAALPDSARPLGREFMELQLDWIAERVREGSRRGSLHPALSPQDTAMLLFTALEGGCIVGRGVQQPAVVLAAFEAIMQSLETPAGVGKRQRKPGPKPSARRSAA
jgi:TetR/AcrR family transcriptional repressor of nem operon